jgi:hypothetical protein
MIFRINLAMLRGRILDYPPAFFPYEFPLFAVFHAARRCLNAAMLCEVILDVSAGIRGGHFRRFSWVPGRLGMGIGHTTARAAEA